MNEIYAAGIQERDMQCCMNGSGQRSDLSAPDGQKCPLRQTGPIYGSRRSIQACVLRSGV